MPRGHRHLGAEPRPRARRGDAERRPRQQQLGGDARLVGAEINRLGAFDRLATLGDRHGRRAGAELCRHGLVIEAVAAAGDEEQRRPLDAAVELGPDFDAVGFAERERALVGQEIEVEIILPDRRQRQAALVP